MVQGPLLEFYSASYVLPPLQNVLESLFKKSEA